MTDQRLKRLTINCNVIKRIAKEKLRYEEEVLKHTKAYEDKVASRADNSDIRMAKAVLDESKMMIPDCQTRLDSALLSLNNLLQECEEELGKSQEYLDAQSLYSEYAAPH